MNEGGSTESRTESVEAVLHRTADRLSDGLVRARDGRITWASARFAELAGAAEPAALLGRPLAGCFRTPTPGHDGLPEHGAECELRGDAGAPSRRVRVSRVGECAPGESLFAVCDLSRLRRVEEELLATGRELHRANRDNAALRERIRRESADREQLLTVVSHELRTPVTVIAGYNRLLLSERVGPLNDEQRRFLHESTKSCQRLSAFIGNLLEAARDVSGDGALEVCEIPLAATLEGVVTFLKPLLEEHRLTIHFDLDPREPRARFDPLRIEQVLTNLIGNAIKYAPAGGTIELSTRAARRDGREVVEVCVADDGPGVPPADRERIFEPYVRAGEASRAGGLGLGLAICKRIVEAHGGTIRVEERAGGGSCFRFSLPGADPPDPS